MSPQIKLFLFSHRNLIEIYLNNIYVLTLRESVKKVVLDFQQPIAPLLRVLDWESNWSMV